MFHLLKLIFILFLLNAPIAEGAIRLRDETTSQGFINEIDCAGGLISCAKSGIKGTVTIANLSGDVVTSGAAATIQANAVALTTDTTGNYAAGDAEAGAALTGDTATSFFALGQLEAARGGTGADSSASTGFPTISAGAWVFTKAVPTGVVVGTTDTQTLTNKTLTDPDVNFSTGAAGVGVCSMVSAVTTNVGNVGVGEDDLITYAFPANTLTKVGDSMIIHYEGYAANNVNAKTLRFYFGTQLLLGPGDPSNDVWIADVWITRTGANAQEFLIFYESKDLGTGLLSTNVNYGAATQTETSIITIKTTGEAVANDDLTSWRQTVMFCQGP